MDTTKNNSHILRMQPMGLIVIAIALNFFIICFFNLLKVCLLQGLHIPMEFPSNHEVFKKKADLIDISPKKVQSIRIFIQLAGEIRPECVTDYWRSA